MDSSSLSPTKTGISISNLLYTILWMVELFVSHSFEILYCFMHQVGAVIFFLIHAKFKDLNKKNFAHENNILHTNVSAQLYQEKLINIQDTRILYNRLKRNRGSLGRAYGR